MKNIIQSPLVFIDTHIAIFLLKNDIQISKKAREQIDIAYENNCLYLPLISKLEIEYLFEIGRLKLNSQDILSLLKKEINLTIYNSDYLEVINEANKIKWTRDPFDRLIVAEALLYNSILITKDIKILKNYKSAIR